MIEIMTSGDFEKVVEALGLKNAKRTYLYTPTEDSPWADSFAVWEFTESEFNILNDDIVDEAWDDKFLGLWWRYAEGTNIADNPDYEVHDFTFHGKPVKAWADTGVDHVDIYEDEDGQQIADEYGYDYLNPLEYCVNEIGASTPKNVDAVCTGLAKLNGMTLAEFFKKYMEEDDEEISE
jgi:hypothetical protein